MSISLLLEMASEAHPERTALVSGERRWTTRELSDLADGGSGVIAASGAQHVVYVGVGGALLPVLIFASARAERGFTPVNYRLSAGAIDELIERLPDPLVVVDTDYRDIIATVGLGEKYTIQGISANGWYYLISGPFGTGWVFSDYLRVLGYTSVIPVIDR